MKRMILCVFPMSICNFRCSYCYLTHRDEAYQGKQAELKYSPEQVGKSFSIDRLGGPCFFNFCADGETLLQKNIVEYIYEVVKQGHYIEIVTNLTVTPIVNTILGWDKELLNRIEFKCSFHYLELKKRKLLDTFSENVNNIWKSGASANVEITPADEYIPCLDEIKKFSLDNFGALPHLSIARNDSTEKIEYLTNMSLDEYDQIWGTFDSDFWKFKKSIFGVKRKEYCYAGKWSLFVNMETGIASQCYCSHFEQNIFENPNQSIKFIPIGKCKTAHCYNGHALLSCGLIPELETPGYGDLRNRTKIDGKEWLQSDLKSFFNSKLLDSNEIIGDYEKVKSEFVIQKERSKRLVKRVLKK